MYVMGIDGGGSSLRVAITTHDLAICGEGTGETANPSIIGHEEAAKRIQAAVRTALTNAQLPPEQIAAVGIGIAGAAAAHSESWLRALAATMLPAAVVAPSADYEIALVGAHGQRQGLLVLAGTGSLAYGISAAGETALAGGWGYLLGDEGSGYWLGAQALRAAVRMADERGRETALLARVLDTLRLEKPLDIIPWLYATSRTRETAALAPLVLDCAAQGDSIARDLIEAAAQELALAVRAVALRLDMQQPPAFTGSLLSQPNPLSTLLCELLGLDAVPTPRYSAVVGGAILALDTLHMES